jgi:pimeloyl-ACP methyl ester carboxylesterase
MPRRILAAIAATFAPCWVLFAACGEATPATPSPQAIATAVSVSRPVSVAAPYSSTPQKGDDDKDPIVLNGRVFGSGPTGVILSHMRLGDQTAWYPFATELAETGDYTVLTYDFRGFNESTGDKQFDRIDTDLAAALDYMREDLGIEEVFLVGASIGGTASLLVASREDVAGVATVSAVGQFPPFDVVDAVAEVRDPKLFITSGDDVPQARAQEEFWEVAQQPKEQHLYPGDAHGTDLFDTEHAEDLKARLKAFLADN